MDPAEKCLSDSRIDERSCCCSCRWSCFRHTHRGHFADESEGRDYVLGEMWMNVPPFGLGMNKTMSDEIAWHCKHYAGRGVRKFTGLVQH